MGSANEPRGADNLPLWMLLIVATIPMIGAIAHHDSWDAEVTVGLLLFLFSGALLAGSYWDARRERKKTGSSPNSKERQG
jgi:hypothetical protein